MVSFIDPVTSSTKVVSVLVTLSSASHETAMVSEGLPNIPMIVVGMTVDALPTTTLLPAVLLVLNTTLLVRL